MNHFILANGTTAATDIVLTLFIVGIVGALIYLLYRSIKNTFIKEKEERQMLIEGVISRSEMNSLIATYIDKMGAETMFSLIYIDLDKFDDFAVAFGSKETKNIIKTVSLLIKESLPRHTFLSRYKGDEFIIFIPNQYSRYEVMDIAENLLKSFRNKIPISDDVEIDLTASIAVAQYPVHGKTLPNLIQSLQLSIHHIKKEGGNNLKVYTQSLETQEEEMNYYYQIKRAISEKQFVFYYQPILNIESKEIYAYESLLRWEHPELGILSPAKFINIMEQTGDIHWVGLWGLETMIKKHIELKDLHEKAPLLSINISPKQLMNPKISEEFQKILRRYRVDANNFILEIGEFLIFERQEVVFENLLKLKKLNFRLAIDEFGIDISSFEQLENMGIDIFKIDFKFIADDTFSVNKYMEFFMQYIKENNKDVIAQGIETKENEGRAFGFGIVKMQGFYYSKPLESEKINTFEYKMIDFEKKE